MINQKLKDEIIYYFQGSCASPHDDQFEDLSAEQVEEILAEAGIENCVVCGWWIPEEDQDVYQGEIVCNECIEEY